MNRQSPDRVVPKFAAGRLESMFSAAGWQVLAVRFGGPLEELFTRPGGQALRHRIVDMPNPEYQRLLRCTAAELRDRLPGTDPGYDEIVTLIGDLDDATLTAAIRNLGGHDLDTLRRAYHQIDDTRPTVIIAYTIMGYRNPSNGRTRDQESLRHCDVEDLYGALACDEDAAMETNDQSTLLASVDLAGQVWSAATEEPVNRLPRVSTVDSRNPSHCDAW